MKLTNIFKKSAKNADKKDTKKVSVEKLNKNQLNQTVGGGATVVSGYKDPEDMVITHR